MLTRICPRSEVGYSTEPSAAWGVVTGHPPRSRAAGRSVQHVGDITATDLESTDQPVAVECLDWRLRAPGTVGLEPRGAGPVQAAIEHLIHHAMRSTTPRPAPRRSSV